jgi:catechol 2,3-dioxygenase-like lactoylglutathione lyase family enzyme
MARTGDLKTVVWDAPDITALADFYVNVAGLTQLDGDDEWITLTGPDGWRFAVQYAPDHVPPRWPDPAYPQQLHLDLQVADIDAAAEQAEKLGARRIGGGETWYVLADPAGHPFCLARADVEGTKIFGVTLDCADASALARFYADLLGLEVTYEGPEGALIGDGSRQLMFQQVADYRPPRWPDPAYPQQLHLDISVPEIEAGERGALALGATRLPGDGENWRVYADPAGHPFCLIYPVA